MSKKGLRKLMRKYWELRNNYDYAIISGDRTRIQNARKEFVDFCEKYSFEYTTTKEEY